MSDLKLCGHSHLAALIDGYRSIETREINIDFVPLSGAKYRPTNFSRLEPRGVKFIPEIYCDNFEKRTGETHIGPQHLWGFCMGGYPFRLDSGVQWQNCRPSPLWEAGKRPITLAQIDAVNEADQKATKHFARNLKDAGVNFFFIALPLSVRSFHENDTESDSKARGFVQNRGRRKFQEWLSNEGIDFIDVPEETIAADGFMNPEYMRIIKPNGAKDYNHGNEKYGELMIAKISKYILERKDK